MTRRHGLLAILSGAAAFIALRAKAAEKVLRPKEVWTLADAKYAGVRVIIVRVEAFGQDQAVHVTLLHVPVSAQINATGETTITHMPLSEGAVLRSIDRQVGTVEEEPAGFSEGYTEWKKHEGGIFTVSISEAIDLMIDTMLTGRQVG